MEALEINQLQTHLDQLQTRIEKIEKRLMWLEPVAGTACGIAVISLFLVYLMAQSM